MTHIFRKFFRIFEDFTKIFKCEIMYDRQNFVNEQRSYINCAFTLHHIYTSIIKITQNVATNYNSIINLLTQY